MARSRFTDMKLVTQARKVVTQAANLQELRAAQSVLLLAIMGATLTETAALLGLGRATVARLQVGFRQSSKPVSASAKRRNWGGRRNALLTVEEEKEFLAPWLEQARAGGMLVVSPLRAALVQELGKPVKPSVVYRLLARHGWRKVAPDTRHPKSDPQVQEDWEKTSANAGGLVETRRSPRPARAADVSRRSAFWAHGQKPALLGSDARAAGGGQRLPAGVCLCLWRGEPDGGGVGLDDLP